jgi:CheY-like chemotaxis protein
MTGVGGRDHGTLDPCSGVVTKPLKQAVLFDALVGAVLGRRGPETLAMRGLDSTLSANLPLRILVAEDNPVNQKVAIRILERLGYRADIAATGLEVLQALRRQPYDVVLMDVQMPEMDGLEASRLIRDEWRNPAAPHIIAMTANALVGDRERCLDAGMNDYVGKPVRVAELQAALERSRAAVA